MNKQEFFGQAEDARRQAAFVPDLSGEETLQTAPEAAFIPDLPGEETQQTDEYTIPAPAYYDAEQSEPPFAQLPPQTASKAAFAPEPAGEVKLDAGIFSQPMPFGEAPAPYAAPQQDTYAQPASFAPPVYSAPQPAAPAAAMQRQVYAAPLSEKPSPLVLVLRIVFTLCTIGSIAFVFYNSLEAGAQSSIRSTDVMNYLNTLMGRLNIGYRFSELLVRKLAHLAEYTMLGFFLMLTLRVYTKRVLSHISWPLFGGLLIPVLDEGLQYFSANRGPAVKDVLIDFGGVCLGLLVALFILLLVRMVNVLRKSKTPL